MLVVVGALATAAMGRVTHSTSLLEGESLVNTPVSARAHFTRKGRRDGSLLVVVGCSRYGCVDGARKPMYRISTYSSFVGLVEESTPRRRAELLWLEFERSTY